MTGRVQQILDDLGIDAVCELIEADMSYQAIADLLGLSVGSLANWLSADPERFARARASRQTSAAACDDKAERVLVELPRDATPAQVARARELAQHYRWRAKSRDPQQYGDKVTQQHEGGVTLQVVMEGMGGPDDK